GDQHRHTARDAGRQHRLGLQELLYLDLLHGLPPPARVPMFHGWCWPATATPRSSLMSPDEAPASTTTGPFSTAQWCASASQYRNAVCVSWNVIGRVSPSPRVTGRYPCNARRRPRPTG